MRSEASTSPKSAPDRTHQLCSSTPRKDQSSTAEPVPAAYHFREWSNDFPPPGREVLCHFGAGWEARVELMIGRPRIYNILGGVTIHGHTVPYIPGSSLVWYITIQSRNTCSNTGITISGLAHHEIRISTFPTRKAITVASVLRE